jgi:hypothetical protein
MLDFFKILFFYKATVLGHYDIDSNLKIGVQDKEVAALMSNAYLSLEVPAQDDVEKDLKLTEKLDAGRQLINDCACQAEIVFDDKKFLLDNVYPSVSANKIYINLSSKDGLPIDIPATEITIHSKRKLEKVLVSWHNSKK